MTEPIRFLDSHVHLWDRSNEWFVTATQEQADAFGMGDIGGMDGDYLPADYRGDVAASRVEVPAVIWVTANLGAAGAPPEVEWAAGLGETEPAVAGIVGAVDPNLPATELARALAEQNASGRLRGVRWLMGLDYEGAAAGELMRALADAGLVYDLVAHQEAMPDAARLAERHPDVPFVLEHCGWPQQPSDPGYVADWKRGIDTLAGAGNVSCKISGLAMALHGFEREAQAPFVEHCLEAFGEDRCLFGSNFPVDALYGGYADLIDLYLELSAPLGPAAQAKLFHANAERIYGVGG